MSLVCSRCGNVYEQVGACPRCRAPAPPGPTSSPSGPGPRWQQTAWGRILIGLILAQGLFYGLRHLATAILLAIQGGESQELWGDVQYLLLLQTIQLVGIFLGALLAGSGQQHGLVLGAVVGAWNGVLAVLLRQNPGQELTIVGLYGLPLLHAAIGTIAGWIGGVIWRPITSAVPAVLAAPRKPAPARRKPALFAGRVAWFRVLAGSAFAVAGTLSATMILQKVLDVSGGKLGTTHEMQDRLITWEIKALAVLVGGALAGATTSNGLKQGLFVGLSSAVVLIGIQAPFTKSWLEVASLTILSTFALSLAGGWFGGQLFPPIVKYDRRREFGAPSW